MTLENYLEKLEYAVLAGNVNAEVDDVVYDLAERQLIKQLLCVLRAHRQTAMII